MFGNWKTVFDGTIGNRPVKALIYFDEFNKLAGYRVSTTQAEDVPGDISVDQTSAIIIPPMEKGHPIDIDAETLAKMDVELQAASFTADETKTILGKF